MKFASLRISLCAVSVVLAGCGTISLESKKIDYKSSSSVKVPTLEIPPDLTTPSRDDRYSVPLRGSATFSEYANDRNTQARGTENSAVLPKVDKARIERAGTQRWLVVASAPDKLWDQIKEFWQETGFLIKLEMPEAGVIETDWAENRAKIGQDFLRNMLGKVLDSLYSTSERDMFRTRLEPGAEPGTTEIYISHRGMVEVYTTESKAETRWQPRQADPELEAEMLRRLMVRFGTDQKRADAEIAATKDRGVDRARLTRSNDGSGTLEVQEAFDRAWRRVGLALDRVGFTVEDRDRSKGLFFVRYVDPESESQNKKDGVLSKLAFWKPSTPPPQERFRVYVKDGGTQTTVQVLSNEGGIAQNDTARKILTLLHEQLK
ncbi:outer membrane protein assembly factor BamC [Propionivibrio dicarboxylicus]|uniref:Beta-barrel assembly machine subunit BamC n=1 Tax=Propionivibrio dicarboxylicus TaxID=83767 RepID=A0A1G8I4F8_9RHOO|nr:outer membrane protein assembly factor BamC [Propionivibrio dicarboxylicus]SDI13753.1 Beta-barrel assembly machine subunit BamC [Propionivibrio dicarboxylicus]